MAGVSGRPGDCAGSGGAGSCARAAAVVPVSAGIHRTLTRLRANQNEELIRWMTTLRRIPAKRLAKLLDDDQLYLGEYEDCPVTVAERERLLGKTDWTVFTTVARLAADPALSGWNASDVQLLCNRCIAEPFGPLASHPRYDRSRHDGRATDADALGLLDC